MKRILLSFSFFLSVTICLAQQKADTIWQRDFSFDAQLGMILSEGTPAILGKRLVQTNSPETIVMAINPESGASIWEVSIPAKVEPQDMGYYKGTPYIEANGYVINPLNGVLLNLGKAARTTDNEPIEVVKTFIFPKLNVVFVYGKVNSTRLVQGVVDEVFCIIEYSTGKTMWTRSDMFKQAEQKTPKKGFGGMLGQAGADLVKKDVQNFEDAKNPGERFLTDPLATVDGTLILPLNTGLFAIDYKTGNVVWKNDYPVKKKGIVTVKASDPTTNIAFSADSSKIYIGRADYTTSIDPKTGKSLWNDPMPSGGPTSYLHITQQGILSLPTKEATMLQNKRICLFNTDNGDIKWELKQKSGVQSFISFGDTVALDLQNAGDKESINLLSVTNGKFMFEKNVRIEGSVLNMKSLPSGLLVVSDEEIAVITKTSGEKKSSVTKKKDQRWIMTSNAQNLFFIISGESKVYKLDYLTGILQPLLEKEIEFSGKETASKLEWYKGHLLVSSDQNLCYVETEKKAILYQKDYKHPGRSTLGKVVSGTGATFSFAFSMLSAGSTIAGGMITGAFISSDFSSVCYELYPEETNAFVSQSLNNMVQGAKDSKTFMDDAVRQVKAISKRFKATQDGQEFVYVLSTDAEDDLSILQVNKLTGEAVSSNSLKKKDKKPDYMVDEIGKRLYYVPRVSLGDVIGGARSNNYSKLISLQVK